MSRKHRIVHLISFVAIMVSLFSPVLTLPVTADDSTAEPEINLVSEPAAQPTETRVAGPTRETVEPTAAPALIRVVPQGPIITDAACGEGVVFAQTASAPVTDGLRYELGTLDAAGNFTLTATLVDSTVYRWAEAGLDGWTVSGSQAVMSGSVAPCPVTEPTVKPAQNEADGIEPADEEKLKEAVTPDSDGMESGQANSRSSEVQASSTDLTMTHSVTPTSNVTPGTATAYETVILTHTQQQIGFTITLPADVTYAGASAVVRSSSGYERPLFHSCVHDAGVVTCSTGSVTIVADAATIWTVNATVNDSPSADTCTNGLVSSVTGNWSGSPTQSTHTPVECAPLLAYTMEADQTEVQPGGSITYTVTVTNSGWSGTGHYAFKKQIQPASLVFDETTFPAGSFCRAFTQHTIDCSGDLSTLDDGEHVYTFRIQVGQAGNTADCGDAITSTFTGTTGEWGSDEQVSEARITIHCEPQLSIKTSNSTGGEATEGEAFNYTVTVANTDSRVSGDYAFTNELPAGIELWGDDPLSTPNGSTCTTTVNNGITTIECEGTGIPENDGEHTYTFKVSANYWLHNDVCGGVENTVTGTSGTWVTDQRLAHSFATVTCAPQLTYAMESDNPNPKYGDEVTFTITVENTGTANARLYGFMTIFSQVPGAIVFQTPQVITGPPDAECSDYGNASILLCEHWRQELPPGEKHVYTILAVVNSRDICQEVPSYGTGTGYKFYELWTSIPVQDSITINCEPLLSIEKTNSTGGEVTEGETFEYSVTVTNGSDIPSGRYAFTDELPAGIELVGDDPFTTPDGGSCTSGVTDGRTTVNCNGTGVPANDGMQTFTFAVRANHDLSPDVCGEVENTVTGTTGQWGARDTAQSTVMVECVPLLTYTLEADRQVAYEGNEITYTVTVENTGKSNVSSYQFWTSIPSTQLDHGGDSWVITNPAGADCRHTQGAMAFDCIYDGVPLPAGDKHVYTVVVTVITSSCGEATVGGGGNTGPWADGSRFEEVTVTTNITCLAIEKTNDTRGEIAEGEAFAYIVTVKNGGGSTSGTYTFVEELPAGIEVAGDNAITSPSGTCTISTIDGITTIECDGYYGVPGNGEHTYTFTVRANYELSADACGTVESTVTGTEGPWGLQSSAQSTVTVTCAPNLVLDISADKTDVQPGDTITYTVTVTNDGSAVEDYLLFRVNVPAGADMAEDPEFSTTPGVSCLQETRLVSCVYADMEPGQTASVTYTVRVRTDVNYSCRDIEARISLQDGGAWDSDNPNVHTIPLRCHELRMMVSDNIPDGESVGLHEPFTYTVTVTNTGGSAIGDFSFANVLPDGIILHGDQDARCEPGPRYENRAIWCSGSEVPLGAGHGVSFEINVVAVDTPVDTDYAGACPYPISYNQVFAESGIWANDSRYVSEQTSVNCVSSVDFSIEPLISNVVPGEPIGFEVTLRNTGGTRITRFSAIDNIAPELPNGAEWTTTLTLNSEPISPEEVPTGLASGDILTVTFESSDVPNDLTLPNAEWCKDWTMSTTLVAGFTWGVDQHQAESATVRVNCTGLSIEQTVSPAAVEPGGQVAYTITVTNQGNTTVSPLYVFHDASETGGVFSNWQVTGEGSLDCGLVEDVDPGCVFLSLEPGRSVDVTITGDAPLNPTAEQCEPVTSQAMFIYGEALTPTQVVTGMASPYTPVYSDAVTTQLDCLFDFTFTTEPVVTRVAPGDVIAYELTLHNSGNMSITSAAIVDVNVPELPGDAEWTRSYTLNGNPVALPELVLAPGDTLIGTITSSPVPDNLTLPEAEWCIDWTVSFTANVGFAWGANQHASDSATVSVECVGLTVDMDVSSDRVPPGDQVEYVITIANNGHAPAQDMFVGVDIGHPFAVFSNWSVSSDYEGFVGCDDPNAYDDGFFVCFFRYLSPGDSATLTLIGDAPELPAAEQCDPVHAWTQVMYYGPAMHGEVMLQSDVTLPFVPVSSNAARTQLDCQPDVMIEIDSDIDLGSNDRVDAGDTITYTINVANSGNLALYDIALASGLHQLEWNNDPTIDVLLPDESETLTAVYTITQADIDAGEMVSTASVFASLLPNLDVTAVQYVGLAQAADPLPMIPDTVEDSITETTILVQEPGILLEVSSSANDALHNGDSITYTFRVMNTGNVTLTDIEITSTTVGLVFVDGAAITTLAPGDAATRTATYTVTDADVEAGSIETCADVLATDPRGDEVTDLNACVTDEVEELVVVPPTPTPGPETPTPTEASETPTPTGTPVTPEAATPQLTTPDAGSVTPVTVTGLPETGHGGTGLAAAFLWSAAVVGLVALAAGGAMGVRRSRLG